MNAKLNVQNVDAEKLKEIFTNKSTTNLILVILMIVLYIFVLFIPKAKTFISHLRQGRQVKAKIVQTEKKWAELSAIKKSITDLNAKIVFYEKELPGRKEIPAILKYLSDSARKLNVRISEIKPMEKKDQAQENIIYYGVPVSLKAECGYHQLGRFLGELENADRFMKISDIKIRGHPKDVNSHYVRLTVTTYVMKK